MTELNRMAISDKTSLQLKEAVFAVIEEHGLENLTQKQVQRYAEEKLGLEEKALKSSKSDVSQLIDDYIEANPPQDEEPEEEEPAAKPAKRKAAKKEEVSDVDDDEEEEEEAPKKKTKKAKEEAEPVEKAAKSFKVETASGEECPKKIKDLQCKMMKRGKFLNEAPDMEIDLWGNKLIGHPREFTSDNMGWYTGGKVEFVVNGKKLWGQVGINLIVMGSKEWKK